MFKLKWAVGSDEFEISGDEASIMDVVEAFARLNHSRRVIELPNLPDSLKVSQIYHCIRSGVPVKVTTVSPNGNEEKVGW